MSNANARVTMLEQQVRGLTADLTVEREAREKAQAGLDDARKRLIVHRDRADAAERKLADVLRRVREFVSKILAEPTVERQVRAMIPEAFEPQGEGDDNDDR